MHGSGSTSRRRFLELAAASGVALAGLDARALAQNTASAELMAQGPLPDIWLGSKDAPVTMIEYASMTCTHCAAFHAETWPTLKSKYIDTGKVRFTMREFPLDPLATAGFLLARCAGDARRYAIIDLLFDQQQNWAFVAKPVEALAGTVKQAGISQTQFETCLKDQKLYDQINAVREKAGQDLKVDATPTFFINGEKHPGELSVDELDKLLAPLVKS